MKDKLKLIFFSNQKSKENSALQSHKTSILEKIVLIFEESFLHYRRTAFPPFVAFNILNRPFSELSKDTAKYYTSTLRKLKNLTTSIEELLRLLNEVFLKRFLAFLFPICCIVCSTKKGVSEYSMCKSCRAEITLLEDYSHCYCCGKRMKISTLCIKCEANRPKFATAKAVFIYNSYVASFIRRIKFHDETFLSRIFADILIQHFKKELEKCDFIVPVPISRMKLAKRQYNQSALIAIHMAKSMKIKVRFDILRKIKNTPSQMSLSMEERKENLRGAFSVRNCNAINDAFIILLDDVVTTGTTVSHCADVLSQHNPRRIIVLSLARTILY